MLTFVLSIGPQDARAGIGFGGSSQTPSFYRRNLEIKWVWTTSFYWCLEIAELNFVLQYFTIFIFDET